MSRICRSLTISVVPHNMDLRNDSRDHRTHNNYGKTWKNLRLFCPIPKGSQQLGLKKYELGQWWRNWTFGKFELLLSSSLGFVFWELVLVRAGTDKEKLFVLVCHPMRQVFLKLSEKNKLVGNCASYLWMPLSCKYWRIIWVPITIKKTLPPSGEYRPG